MRGVQARVALSLLMIAAGVLFLLQNLGFLEGAGAILWALAFAVAGAAFLYVYFSDRVNWWALIPAGICIVLGTIVLVDQFHLFDEELIPFILFLGIGLTFGFLYGIKDENNQLDWAKYPAVFLVLFSFFFLVMVKSAIVLDILLPDGFIIVGGILIYRALRKK